MKRLNEHGTPTGDGVPNPGYPVHVRRGDRAVVKPDSAREMKPPAFLRVRRGDRAIVSPEPVDRGETPRSGKPARGETAAALKGTFTAFIKRAVELVAHAHGLGVLLKTAEWVWTAAKWLQVGAGHREVDLEVPIPLGAGIDLDLSVHPEHSSGVGQPLVTVCFAPSGGADPGVLVIDGCQFSPGDSADEDLPDRDRKAARHVAGREAEKAHVRSAESAEDEGWAVPVCLDLAQLTSRERDPRVRAAALMYLAKNQLLPALEQQQLWDELKAAGVECVVYYDQEAKESVWLLLGDTERRPVRRRIAFDAVGRLRPWPI